MNVLNDTALNKHVADSAVHAAVAREHGGAPLTLHHDTQHHAVNGAGAQHLLIPPHGLESLNGLPGLRERVSKFLLIRIQATQVEIVVALDKDEVTEELMLVK